jgi:hypothetical protein
LKKKLFFLLLLILIGNLVNAETKPLWPLDIEISQSSSYAEFRGFRFHAGIDLRTKRTTGFPVRAIADGFISRMKVQYRGYGYALYIDHPTLQRRVVYGHLQDFSGAPGEYARKKLKKIGQRYGIDDFFGPDKFPVKKGQVIALSGETGSGPPHLHFEVRTLSDEPIAPALLGFRPEDKIFPRFYRFYLEPYSFPCEINGSFLPYNTTIKMKKHDGLLSEPIELSGIAGVKIGVLDRNGVGNVYGVEEISLKIDGKVLFERKFHKFSYAQNSQCSLVYDYIKSNQKNTGYVVNMFKLPGETLPFSQGFSPWSGLISDAAIENSVISLVARDFGRNRIGFTGEISCVKHSYDEVIPVDMAENFSFNRIVSAPKYLVAQGQMKSKASVPFKRGKIACLDANGKSEYLPAIVSGKNIEIAIPFSAKWENGVWINNQRIMPSAQLVTQQGRKVSSEEGGVAEFAKSGLILPVFARFYRSNLAPGKGGNSKTGFLQPFSAIWKLEPEEVVFADDVKLRIQPAGYNGNLQKLGIYSVSESGRYRHVGEKVEKGQLVATTRTGGSWLILEDKVAPVIKYQRRSKDYHLGKVWVFRVSDLGEGVNYLSASAVAGKKKFEVYSDPDKAEIYVVRPADGKTRKIELAVEDYAGNLAKISKNLN